MGLVAWRGANKRAGGVYLGKNLDAAKRGHDSKWCSTCLAARMTRAVSAWCGSTCCSIRVCAVVLPCAMDGSTFATMSVLSKYKRAAVPLDHSRALLEELNNEVEPRWPTANTGSPRSVGTCVATTSCGVADLQILRMPSCALLWKLGKGHNCRHYLALDCADAPRRQAPSPNPFKLCLRFSCRNAHMISARMGGASTEKSTAIHPCLLDIHWA